MKSTAERLKEYSKAVYGENTDWIERAATEQAQEMGFCGNRETSYVFDDGSTLHIKPMPGRFPVVTAAALGRALK